MTSSVEESGAAPKKMIKLMSLDGEMYELEEKAARLCVTIKHMIDEGFDSDVIPLPNVNAKNLTLVVDYCKSHVEGEAEEIGKKFDDGLVNQELCEIFELILAANFLDIRGLLDLLCQAVADRIKDEPVERVRQILNIQNDYTPEEEAAIRLENAWAFE